MFFVALSLGVFHGSDVSLFRGDAAIQHSGCGCIELLGGVVVVEVYALWILVTVFFFIYQFPLLQQTGAVEHALPVDVRIVGSRFF